MTLFRSANCAPDIGNERSTRRADFILSAASVAVILLALLTLSSAVTKATKTISGSSGFLGNISEHLNPFRARHSLLQSGLPVYDLRIEPAEYRNILSVIESARRRGSMTEDLKQWSRAEFVAAGSVRSVKIRVRGDTDVHWKNDRRSWRIRFRSEEPFDGQREINLIVTGDGKGITEYFTNAVFRRLGMMTLRDRYVVLRINGIPQGVYYQVEHFDAPLLVHHQRSESAIFRNPRTGRELGSYEEYVTDGDADALRALQFLLNVETGGAPASFETARALTDMDDYLRWLAGVALFCSDHSSLITDNQRLSYDRTTGRFSRIPWDMEPTRIPEVERFELEDWHSVFDVSARWPMSAFAETVLQRPDLRLERNRVLWDLVKNDDLLSLFDETYKDVRFALWTDVMGRGDEESRLDAYRALVAHNVGKIRGVLASRRAEATVRTTRDEAVIEIAVNSDAGLILRAVRLTDSSEADSILKRTSSSGETGSCSLYRDGNRNGELDESDVPVGRPVFHEHAPAVIDARNEILLTECGLARDYPAYLQDSGAGPGVYRTKPLRSVIYPKTTRYSYILKCERIPGRDRRSWPAVTFDSVNAVTGEPYTEKDWSVRQIDVTAPFDPLTRTLSRDQFLASNPSFVRGAEDSTVILPGGRHNLEGVTIVPIHVTLKIEPGTTLRMAAGASLLCFGPIRAEGRIDAPIRVEPLTGEPWGTLASVHGAGESAFRHVHASGGAGVNAEGMLFTGALAVHRGDVVMEHCRFTQCAAEDAVNVKNGRVMMRRCFFGDNDSDSLDLDFVTGSIEECHFASQMGDAVDLCGSDVRILQCRIEGAGDKGISIGESSVARIIDTLVMNSNTGLAAKDLSRVEVESCTFLGNFTAVAAYCKKPIFGGGRLTVKSSILADSDAVLHTDALSSADFRDCLSDAKGPLRGAIAAPPGLSGMLRSHEFVHAIPADERADPSSRNLHGLRTRPVDLR